MTKILVPMKQLKLADRVRLFDGPYGDATLTQIVTEKSHTTLTFIRPYVHTSDFSYTGGVIPYLGWEECVHFMDPEKPYELLERAKEPR